MTTEGGLLRSTARPPRSVLMVLYYYPPLGGVSTSRNARNVQYLPRHGWMPVVLTPRDPATPPSDPSTLALIPTGIRVIRTASLEAGHMRSAVVGLRGVLATLRDRARRPPSRNGKVAGDTAGSDRGRSRALGVERLRRLVFFPDDQVGWLPFAVVAALQAHRAARFDAVYTTSSPITAHLVGGIVKGLTGLPWVAEFRDPWVGNALEAPLPWLHRRLRARIERWIVSRADQIVCVTPSLTRLYQARYPRAAVVTIPNGYDRSEAVARTTTHEERDRFRIVFAGTLERPRELRVFLQGLDALVARRPDLANRLEIAFYGTVAESCREVASRFSRDGHLSGMLQFPGFVPRGAALQAVANADAALVLLGDGPGTGLFVGGKLYDYLGQNVQILAMVPLGDARDVLEGLQWGVVAAPNPADVERALEQLITTPLPGRPADPEGLYDRAELAGRVAATLDDAARSAARRSTRGDL